MQWSTACIDWRERILARQSLITFAPLFPEEARAALEVFKSLQVVDLPRIDDPETSESRHPTFGEVSDPWVLDFVSAVFGAYDAENARRLIEEFFLLVSKKNGKSTIVAGIMLTALLRNWRYSAELLILAPTREVADNSFKPAADMVRADRTLSDLLRVRDDLKQITHRLTKAILKVVSADSSSSAGKKAAFVLVEELWLFGKKAGASGMMQEATGGLASRPEGFVIYISTQSDTPPTGIFKEKLDYFRDVRDGKINDPRSLPVIYEFPEQMVEERSYLEPRNFYVTNPNIGRSVRKDWLERKLNLVRSGQDEEGDTIQTFLAKHLNVEIGMNLRANRWPGAEYWPKRTDPSLTKQELLERSEVVIAGFDGGGLDDLLGGCLLGRDGDTKEWLSWSTAWCHHGVLSRRKSIASVLTDFEAAGELTIVDDDPLVEALGKALQDGEERAAREIRAQIKRRGYPVDIAAVAALCNEALDRGLLAEVAVDPAGLGLIVDALDDIGITQENGLLVGVGQGYRLMNAIKTAERRLQNGTLWHCGSSLMAWCVSNVKIEPTATAIRATKQNAGDAKIDAWVAMINAVDRMALNPTAGAPLEIAAMVA